jgi:hypothetical protein
MLRKIENNKFELLSFCESNIVQFNFSELYICYEFYLSIYF